MSERQQHWESVYQMKASDGVSWYRPHLETSLRLLAQVAPDREAAVIDVGAGSSTLVDDLLALGYRRLSLLDLSATALEVAKRRLGASAAGLQWIAGDIAEAELPSATYDVWHDRAVFHFLTTEAQRTAYLRQLNHALKPGGHLILATFGPQGPEKCSGLHVERYDAQAQQTVLGAGYRLVESLSELHRSPAGSLQQFQYGLFRRG
ncbi:MAG TPA: class I SAM-dependent methyltransferase [Solimonas sp.]|nr:class I SAM-dependent methyltransferase [Solimonas sp.]